jgi:hypothetical protein
MVDLKFDNIEADKAIKELLKAAGVNYAFRADLSDERISCSLNQVSAERALQTILSLMKEPTTYRVDGGTVIIASKR